MKHRMYELAAFTSVIVVLCLSAAVAVEQPANTADATLHIHLPRQVTVEGSSLTLGSVGIIRGADELAQKANSIPLGKIALPGQQIVIDRPTVLSRLACSGIPASQVTLTGAEQTTVKKQSHIIAGSDLLEMALLYLNANKPHDSICQFTPVKVPHDFNLPESGSKPEIRPLVARITANTATVHLVTVEDGKERPIDEAIFRLKYNCRQVKAVTDISIGGVITPENVKIEQGFSDAPQPEDWQPPYGRIAARRLPAGVVVTDHMLVDPKPEIIVKRNQNVLIKVENAGLFISAMGKALQDAHAGQYIKVLNVDSGRQIFAKVKEDATVEPVF
jgi:flagella basal body P-ring formation protein FlgA